MEVSSPGAQAIRIHLTAFSLPSNTEMYLLGPNGQADGPYTGTGRDGTGDFWTRSIVSDTGQLVLRYTGASPEADQGRMSFVVSDVGHISGRHPRVQERSHDDWPCSDNAPCVVDAQCVNVSAVTAAKEAVAKMEWTQGPFIYTCSGGLIADTDTGSQIPYFLTANHCFSSNKSNLETFFNYTTDACNGSCPDSLVTGGTPPPASTVGITVVATGNDGDFTLGTLNQAPPAGAVFLGWNNTPIANTNGADLHRISNANFGPQVYSKHDVDTRREQRRGGRRPAHGLLRVQLRGRVRLGEQLDHRRRARVLLELGLAVPGSAGGRRMLHQCGMRRRAVLHRHGDLRRRSLPVERESLHRRHDVQRGDRHLHAAVVRGEQGPVQQQQRLLLQQLQERDLQG
jgi:hypothetical protein